MKASLIRRKESKKVGENSWIFFKLKVHMENPESASTKITRKSSEKLIVIVNSNTDSSQLTTT